MHLTDAQDIPACLYPFLGMGAVAVVLVAGVYSTWRKLASLHASQYC